MQNPSYYVPICGDTELCEQIKLLGMYLSTVVLYVCIKYEPNAYPFTHIDKVLARLNGNG